jgi:helix-turn-helix protein
MITVQSEELNELRKALINSGYSRVVAERIIAYYTAPLKCFT